MLRFIFHFNHLQWFIQLLTLLFFCCISALNWTFGGEKDYARIYCPDSARYRRCKGLRDRNTERTFLAETTLYTYEANGQSNAGKATKTGGRCWENLGGKTFLSRGVLQVQLPAPIYGLLRCFFRIMFLVQCLDTSTEHC